ncbi:Putative serine/threonine-protein kinase pknH [Minicystis rosea]|nr:Putative serine/threonine-protein kinase pknH [Minicystis rosea]
MMTSLDLLAPGAVFARDFTIVRPLSEGGMGAVYVVEQISTGAQRALKLMHRELVRDPKLRQRFEQEARVGSRIESEHVVQVLAAGVDETSGMPWLMMELLSGEDLAGMLEKRGPLPHAEVRDIFAQLTHAVAAAHKVGVVHRDLKPENVFIARSRREGTTHLVKVLDFGIAKVVAEAQTSATQALGTPMWMAPEQTEPGRAIAPAADVWALGLIAFRMLTGKYFWVAGNRDDANYTMVLREAVFDPIPSAAARAEEYGARPLLPAGFDAWFARCMSRAPEARFPDAGAAREAFFEMMDGAAQAPSGPHTIAAAPLPLTPSPAVTAPAHALTALAVQPATPVVGAAPIAIRPQVAAKPPSSSKGALVGIAALGVVLLAGGGIGLRSHTRSQNIKTCESGKGDDLLAACKAACDADPKAYCTVHGNLARAALDTASLETAARSYEKACSAQDWRGCRKLGALQEIEHKDAEALANDQKSCDGEGPSGCALLGRRLEHGRGIAKDPAKALSFYEAACAENDPVGCVLLGWASQNRPLPRREEAQTRELFRRATEALRNECKAGGLWECMAAGTILQHGTLRDAGPDAAAPLFRKACDGGLTEACNNASALALAGPGPNVPRELDALRKACSAGVPAACNNLALAQANVPFTLRQDQGVTAFRVTCTDALTLGCTQRGTVIRPPAGLSPDPGGALSTLENACSDGLGVACMNLGAFQESGLHVPRDPQKALASYEKGCAAGAPDGCTSRNEPPFRAGESWKGAYTCGQGQTDLTLRILEPAPGERVNAIFDFDYGSGKVGGRFLVSGAYDAARGTVTFSPGIWLEQPANWVTVGLTGQVSLQKTIFAGKIDNPSCGAFRLVRQTSDMIDSFCPEGHFVEGHGCVPVPRAGANALGAWTGRGVEASGASWPLSGTIQSLESGLCGHVSYPSLGCTGDWYCIHSSDGTKLRAREIITHGSRCDSTGFVDLTLSNDGQSAEWRWSSPIRPGGSTASLTRSAPP